ncbi:hypothetical protein YTPLAS72_01330 [Nitrospira sp.]|nr:hypothetical protein YTPLAS72_01330 [Nitrospira sp.]
MKKMNMTGVSVVMALSFIAGGCASGVSPVTPGQLAETEATIRSAESAGAFDRAPDLLQKARQALGAAQQASGRKDHQVARDHILEATAYAEAAQAKAQTEQMKSEATAVRRQADELEAKIKR